MFHEGVKSWPPGPRKQHSCAKVRAVPTDAFFPCSETNERKKSGNRRIKDNCCERSSSGLDLLVLLVVVKVGNTLVEVVGLLLALLVVAVPEGTQRGRVVEERPVDSGVGGRRSRGRGSDGLDLRHEGGGHSGSGRRVGRGHIGAGRSDVDARARRSHIRAAGSDVGAAWCHVGAARCHVSA